MVQTNAVQTLTVDELLRQLYGPEILQAFEEIEVIVVDLDRLPAEVSIQGDSVTIQLAEAPADASA